MKKSEFESLASILNRMLNCQDGPLGRFNDMIRPPYSRPLKDVQEMEEDDAHNNPSKPRGPSKPGRVDEKTEKKDNEPREDAGQKRHESGQNMLPGLDRWSKSCRDPTTRHDEITERRRRLTRKRNRRVKR